MHGYRLVAWIALADFFCCIGLLMLGVYGRVVQDIIDVPRDARDLLAEIVSELNRHPAFAKRATYDARNYALRIPAVVLFDFDSSVVSNPAALRPLAEAIRKRERGFERFTLEITGHTDDYGTRDYNYELSRSRASSVAETLVRLGLDPTRFRITTRGVGASQPLVDNCAPVSPGEKRFGCLEKQLRIRPQRELAENRRIELSLGIQTAALADAAAVSAVPKK